MEKDTVTVRTYAYMPYHWLWGIFLFAAGAFLLWRHQIIFGIVVVALAAMVLTAHYGIRVNLREKTYTDFLSILGMMSGEEEKFAVIDYVFIKTSKKSMTANSLITSKTFTDNFFDGYIKFDGEEKVYLLSHKKKATVMKVLEELSVQLKVEIVDHSQSA